VNLGFANMFDSRGLLLLLILGFALAVRLKRRGAS
jgi:hypothetical protein